MRIVSLVPSLTRTLVDLGLKTELVGITNFCVDPPDLHRTATRIGGTKDPDIKAIAALAPTHVIVNEEENRSDDIEALKSSFNILSTFPKAPEDVPEMLISIGHFLGFESRAGHEAALLTSDLDALRHDNLPLSYLGKTCAYLIWRNPWMAVSQDTYISRFLRCLGLENVVKSAVRYPVVHPDDIVALSPDVIFMSSEPWPFRKRDAEAWRSMTVTNGTRLLWIDGKATSWYGTPTRDALRQARFNDGLVREL